MKRPRHMQATRPDSPPEGRYRAEAGLLARGSSRRPGLPGGHARQWRVSAAARRLQLRGQRRPWPKGRTGFPS